MSEDIKSAEGEQAHVGEVLTAAEIETNPIDEAKKILEETKKTLNSITEERKRIENR